ncbi:MAG: hypothetical protein ABR878_08800 [Roseiarcus sp.]|jgi:hypothetical protein
MRELFKSRSRQQISVVGPDFPRKAKPIAFDLLSAAQRPVLRHPIRLDPSGGGGVRDCAVMK